MPIIDNNTEDADSGSSRGSGKSTHRKLFMKRGYLLQGALAQGERKFGEIDWGRREIEPPLEEQINDPSHSEEDTLAAANEDVIEPHEWLTCQQFDGRDPKRDPRIPSAEDIINYADNHPEAQLTLNPQLRLTLENAKRHRMAATPTMKPGGM